LTYEKLKEGEIENNFQFDKLVHVKQIAIKKIWIKSKEENN
jgi:hypothetical protein